MYRIISIEISLFRGLAIFSCTHTHTQTDIYIWFESKPREEEKYWYHIHIYNILFIITHIIDFSLLFNNNHYTGNRNEEWTMCGKIWSYYVTAVFIILCLWIKNMLIQNNITFWNVFVMLLYVSSSLRWFVPWRRKSKNMVSTSVSNIVLRHQSWYQIAIHTHKWLVQCWGASEEQSWK